MQTNHLLLGNKQTVFTVISTKRMNISISLHFPAQIDKPPVVFLDDILQIHKWSALQIRIDDNQSLKRFAQRFIRIDHRHRVQQRAHELILHFNRFYEPIGAPGNGEGLQIPE